MDGDNMLEELGFHKYAFNPATAVKHVAKSKYSAGKSLDNSELFFRN